MNQPIVLIFIAVSLPTLADNIGYYIYWLFPVCLRSKGCVKWISPLSPNNNLVLYHNSVTNLEMPRCSLPAEVWWVELGPPGGS